ncbi:MAG: ester cyclase [Acidobacteriia bacterium]|nr:ester cyclase [Terriglobia bacterium]
MSNNEARKRTMNKLLEEVWNRQNLGALTEVFTENAIMHHGGPEDRGGHDMAGISAFREGYIRPTQAAFPDIQHQAKDLLFDGDRVVMRFHGEGTHKGEFMGIAATNKVMRYEGIAIFRMQGDRIAEVWVHSNAARQLAALAA